MNRQTLTAIAIAAVLWFAMFSPWTKPFIPFWPAMSLSAAILSLFAMCCDRSLLRRTTRIGFADIASGIALAAAFWGLFWICEKLATSCFGFARPQIDSIYALADGASKWAVAAILILLVGPAEELFWRGFIQHRIAQQLGPLKGFFVATAFYALVHVWSFNLMLILAAAVIGGAWGLAYRFFPRRLGAIAISHALWDVAAFVVFPL